MDRRTFVLSVGELTGGALLLTALASCQRPRSFQQAPLPRPHWSRPGDPTAVVFEKLKFRSGADEVPAYLARPNRPGTFPAVIVIHANWLSEPYIAETTSLLAEAGFVALAIDLFHFYPADYTWQEARRVPSATISETLKREFRESRMVGDISAGIAFLDSVPSVREGSVGLIGFCGGGWNALLAAAQLDEIGAVVAFYAPVAESDVQHRAPLSLARYISSAVQYHQPANDEYVPSVDVDRLEAALKEAGTRFDRYVYPATHHGFFAYDRGSIFNADATNLAWSRMIPFLHETLGEPARAHPLAPPAPPSQDEEGQPNQAAASPLHQHGR